MAIGACVACFKGLRIHVADLETPWFADAELQTEQ